MSSFLPPKTPTVTKSVVAGTIAGPRLPSRLRLILLAALFLIPVAWWAAFYQQKGMDRVGVPDVTLPAPDMKPVVSLDYDPGENGTLLISACDKTGGGAILWLSTDKADSELPTRDSGAWGKVPFRRNRTLRAYTGGNGGAALYSDDGKYIATWSGRLTLWHNTALTAQAIGVPTKEKSSVCPLYFWRTEAGKSRLVYAPDSAHAVLRAPEGGADAPINAKDAELVLRAAGFPVAARGDLLASGDGSEVILADARTGAKQGELRAGDAKILSVAVSRAGDKVAAGDAHGWVYRYDLGADGRFVPARKPRFGHAQNPGAGAPGVTAVAFSPDGKTLATGGTDGAVYLWRL